MTAKTRKRKARVFWIRKMWLNNLPTFIAHQHDMGPGWIKTREVLPKRKRGKK